MVGSSVPEARCEEVLNAYFKVLQTPLGELDLELLAAEGVDIGKGLGPE